MRFHQWVGRALATSVLCFGASLALAGNASAYTVAGGGIDQALGCSNVACGSTQTLTLDTSSSPVALLAGTIDLDTSGLELSFSLSVLEVSLVPLLGGDDNGATGVVFSNTSYSASGLSLLALGGGSFLIGPGQTAAVSGTQTQTGVSGPAGFAAPNARVNGTCLDLGDGLSCGLSFGQASFSFDVGSNPETRYFQHTANIVAAVPEPTTAALLGLALLGAAWTSRRRS